MRAQVTHGQDQCTAGEQESQCEDSGKDPDALGVGSHDRGGSEKQRREPLQEDREAQCAPGGVVHGFSVSFGRLKRLLDGLDEDLEGLSARDPVLAVEDEERDAIGPEGSCELSV